MITTNPGMTGVGSSGAAQQAMTDRLGFFADFTNVPNGVPLAGFLASSYGGTGSTPFTILQGGGSGATASTSGGLMVPAAGTGNTVFYAVSACPNSITSLAIEFMCFAGATTLLTMAYGANTTLAVNVLHLQCSLTGFTLMSRVLGNAVNGTVPDTLISGTWDYPINPDGTTLYRIKMASFGDTVVVTGPYGESFSITDPRIHTLRGDAFFWESNDPDTRAKRIYATDNPFAGSPNAFGLPSDISVSPIAMFNGNPTLNIGKAAGIDLTPAALSVPTLNFGGFVVMGHIQSAMTAGTSTTFTCDQPLPNGTYELDFISAEGANTENVTVTGSTGSGPYTITVSAAVAKNHAADAVGSPTLCISTFTIPQGALYGLVGSTQLGTKGDLLVGARPDGALTGGVLRICGVDYYSGCIEQAAANYLKAIDKGPGNPTSFGVTGGFRAAEGGNAKQGTGVLVAGTVTIANTSVTANSRIFLTTQTPGGTPGALYVSARTAGTSFNVTSTNGADTSTFAYEIFEPA